MDEEEEEKKDEVSSNNSGKHPFFDINKDIIEVFSTKLHRVVTGGFTGQTDDTVTSVNRRYHHDVDSSGVYDDNDYIDNENNDNYDNNDDSDNDNDNDHDNNDGNDKNKSRSESRNKNRSKKSEIRKNIDNVTTEITNILNLFNKKTSINIQLDSKTSDKTHVIINRNDSHSNGEDNDNQHYENSSIVSSTINNTEINKLTETFDQNTAENNLHVNDVAKDQTEPSETKSQPGYNAIVLNNINEVEDRIKLFIEQKKLYLLERKKLKLAKKERQEERDRKKIFKIDKRYAAKITEKDFSPKSRTRTNGLKRTRFERNVRGKIMNMNDLNSDNTSSSSSSSSSKRKNKSDKSEEEKNGDKESRNVLSVKKAGTSSSILSRRKAVKEVVEVDNNSHINSVNNNDNNHDNSNNNDNNNNNDNSDSNNKSNNNDNNHDNENEHHTNNEINKSPSSQSVLLPSKRKPKYLSFANLTVTRKKGPVKGLGVRALSDLPRSARTTVSTTVSTSNSVRAPVKVNNENALDMESAIEKEFEIGINEVEVEKVKSALESIENENENENEDRNDNDNKSNITESDGFPHNTNIVEDHGSNSRNTSSSSSIALDNLFAMLGENNGNENTENEEEVVGCNDTNSTVQSVCNDNVDVEDDVDVDDVVDVEDDIFDLINVINKNQKKRKQEELTLIERKKSSKKENERNEIFKNQQKQSEKESRKRICLGDDLESFLGA